MDLLAGVEEDDFIWGGTKEIADRPRGRKATARPKCGSNSNTQQKYGNTENIIIVLFGTGNGCWPISIVLR